MFYPYRQFNSDGPYLLDENNAIFIIIEANNDAQALEIATAKGLVFEPPISGTEGTWYMIFSATDDISVYTKHDEFFTYPKTNPGDVIVRILYLDGTTKEVIQKTNKLIQEQRTIIQE